MNRERTHSRDESNPHQSFVEGSLCLEEYKPQFLKKIKRAKQKLDEIAEKTEGIPNIDDRFLDQNVQLLQSITCDFIILEKALQKLEKDNLNEYSQQRHIFIKTIRQQSQRFNSIIPSNIKAGVNKILQSSNELIKSKISMIMTEDDDEHTKFTPEEEQKFSVLAKNLKDYVKKGQKREKENEEKERLLVEKLKKQKVESEERSKIFIIFITMMMLIFMGIGGMVIKNGIKSIF